MTNLKEVTFEQPSYDQWQEAAVKQLKGKPFESLLTKTIEGITLQPLYTEEKLLEALDGKLEEQVSTVRALKADGDFGVAQQAFGSSIEEFVAQTNDAFDRGAQFVTVGKVAFDWDDHALHQLAQLIDEYQKVVLYVDDETILTVFNYIQNKEIEGFIISEQPTMLPEYKYVRTLNAHTEKHHYAGANATQELAIALAQAAELSGDDFTQFENRFFASFAIDTQFFMEIAKIRAFRVLWKAFAQAYGVEQPKPVQIVTETSLRTFSKLDAYVNLLRAGNEAFSAVIGGADVVTVHPHNVLTGPTNQSIRIARNAALVIKEESHVTKVLDPAGGSYFIESLTHDLVKNAWAYFLEIQAAGGYTAAREKIASDVNEVWMKRLKDVETRKSVLVGTNNFADATEEVVAGDFINVNRLAKPFEKLRQDYKENPVKVAVLAYGELKKIKPRTDFVTGIFATAGVIAEVTEPFTDVEAAKAFLETTDAQVVVFSGVDEDVENVLPQIASSKQARTILDVAGKFDSIVGVDGALYAGMNIYEKLEGIQESLKEVQR
ncbi:methylmalonyl-CoA mutase family protein [Kurthia senegalensis]|uniref:methylmalonyl-CoA mutase family protein n=1 Tax=Kurthia senegalensis TaxID=1033740 RepID=UPI000288D988|nr:methylmalonyl-CoA mutase family protein [Kurthia senegalensis]